MYEQGMRVIVAHRPVNPLECLDPRVKTLNYLNHIMAKCEGIDFGCHEVVRLNMAGDVCEGSGDNLFMIKDGVVYTPPPEAGILEGITREFVMKDLCPAVGVKCVEKRFKLDELLKPTRSSSPAPRPRSSPSRRSTSTRASRSPAPR
jgi:branched-chain amino acid aminotransferase